MNKIECMKITQLRELNSSMYHIPTNDSKVIIPTNQITEQISNIQYKHWFGITDTCVSESSSWTQSH